MSWVQKKSRQQLQEQRRIWTNRLQASLSMTLKTKRNQLNWLRSRTIFSAGWLRIMSQNHASKCCKSARLVESPLEKSQKSLKAASSKKVRSRRRHGFQGSKCPPILTTILTARLKYQAASLVYTKARLSRSRVRKLVNSPSRQEVELTLWTLPKRSWIRRRRLISCWRRARHPRWKNLMRSQIRHSAQSSVKANRNP